MVRKKRSPAKTHEDFMSAVYKGVQKKIISVLGSENVEFQADHRHVSVKLKTGSQLKFIFSNFSKKHDVFISTGYTTDDEADDFAKDLKIDNESMRVKSGHSDYTPQYKILMVKMGGGRRIKSTVYKAAKQWAEFVKT